MPPIPGIHLRTITLRILPEEAGRFPFNVPAIRSLTTLELVTPVTFLVGENGCGKSTLLEALAVAAGSITVGSEAAGLDKTLKEVRSLAAALRLAWNKKTRRGFFMRSEDFFGYARRMVQIRQELTSDLEDVDREYRDRPGLARDLARSPYLGELGALRRQYGEGLDAQSHGESYLKLFQARFVPDGLYLLDEPEAPLSPLRQLSFLVLLKEMVAQNAQFIIATHSPILMAYPGATILSLDDGQARPIRYQDLEHVQITRLFLENPERYLRRLFAGDESEEGGAQ